MDQQGNAKPLLWIGVAGLLLTGIFTVWMGPHSATKLQRKVQAAAETALAASGVPGLHVVADGQAVKLTGVIADEGARRQAADRVLGALGPGGVLQGGVTAIHFAGVAIMGEAKPFAWGAHKEVGKILLDGVAPSAEDRKAITDAARAIFPDAQVADEMKLASGAPAGVDWLQGAKLGLQAMQPLVRGDARLVDDTLTVTGIALTEEDVAGVAAGLSRPVQGLNAISQVTGPPEWMARLADGKLTFSGLAPTSAAQKNIATAASASFKGPISDQTRVGIAGAFAARAVAAMPQFAQFRSGEIAAQGRRFIISGEATESALTYLKEDMKRVIDSYSVDYQVRVLAPALPELEDINLDKGSPNLKAECQAAFGKVMAANKILFATGTATITRQSGEALDKVAEVARRCSEFRLEVQGYTDNRGRQPANIKLSQSRAEAVRAWMQDKGVPADRLSATGFGSDNPIASNARESGRAQNRRIEFKVSG